MFFQQETGTQFALVPYRGDATAIPDLMAGHFSIAIRSGVKTVR
jgi:tripartite-type tricarboxylate transporter receptor subunit TctC